MDILPIFYLEVVPGDTVSGKVRVKVQTDMVKSMVVNRAFYDCFAFYVPFRLLDSGFVAGITTLTGTPLQDSNTFDANFEHQQMGAGDHGYYTRAAYNLVWNTFFRRKNDAAIALNATNVKKSALRPSTFHEAAYEVESDVTTETINVTQGTSTDTFTVDS